MRVKTITGEEVEIDMDQMKKVYDEVARRLQHAANAQPRNAAAENYAAKTHEIMEAAQNELREATGDYPEDLKELYEFAAKHQLFGDREDTHIMCNFMKVFFCLMQKETHEA